MMRKYVSIDIKKKEEIIVMYLSTMPIVIVGEEKNCSYKHNNIQTLFLELNKNCGSLQNYTKCII